MKKQGMHVALFRGINVGGNKLLPMADLAEIFHGAGASDVVTFIQSGNVVFRAAAPKAAGIATQVIAEVQKRFGFHAPILLRTHAELARIVSENPFLARSADPKKNYLAFLQDVPSAAAAAALDPNRSPPDAFELRGKDLYLHFPNGVGKTKLTNDYLDRTLKTVSTVRNWNTVTKLFELSA
jgi:uncharacterized protein (DUF1697 family)